MAVSLQKGGVLRLSFPSFGGVLKRHYRLNSQQPALECKSEAYIKWGHRHFFSKKPLFLLCKHIGLEKIHFVEYGISIYSELCNLDARKQQKGINMYVELTK